MMRFDKTSPYSAASSMCAMRRGSMALFSCSCRWLCCACLASNECTDENLALLLLLLPLLTAPPEPH
eukprot:4855913-Pleurochrysis_carterae.AAC.1